MKEHRKIPLFFLALVMSFQTLAQKQDSLRNSLSSEKILLLNTLWSESGNAAGLQSFDIQYRLGTARLLYQHENGDYHRFQEGEKQNQYGFQTYGYQKLNNWKFYGAFSYYSQEEKKVKWVDVLNPYDDNPYTLGDGTGGTYRKEFFDMQVRGALKLSSLIDLGFDVKYQTGVGARRKDPRPTNKATEFDFKPGIVFRPGKFMAGLNLHLQTAKEDISLKTLSDSTYNFYHFRGMGVYSATTEMDDRSNQSTLLGAGLQLGWKGDRLSNLTEISFFQKETDIKRGKLSPIQLVLLEKFQTEAASTFILRNTSGSIHKLKLYFTDKHIYGHEPVMEPKATQEKFHWETIAKYVLYWHREDNFGFDYSWYTFQDRDHINWGVKAGAMITGSETSYYFVPEKNKQKLNQYKINAAVEKEISTSVADIILSANGAYRKGFNSRLNLVSDPALLETTHTEMVHHDFDYWNKGMTELGGKIQLARRVKMYEHRVQLYTGIDYTKRFSQMTGDPEKNSTSIQVGINF
ncbi:hypothetical protein D1614_20865 [Maribellus luteus]|uniref:DUF6850 domain-containing protein n=1 Tax=Maribellus luteus TaxID=2305463 RepID=A0A399SVF9_9BACT|nr:DUF6850 family outer membrane beta-barrel protein [Maribellus luteus]RIJ45973.1 hypothetical protein D1614_20865 [Maribellus luteus]